MRYQEDYDAIICVANWPESRKNVWSVLLRARAIENQCFVIGCNRVGVDPNCHYIGHSSIIDSRGETIIEDLTQQQTTVTAEINVEKLKEFREKFCVLKDRDKFEFKK
jgi:predicted amidohydrolase